MSAFLRRLTLAAFATSHLLAALGHAAAPSGALTPSLSATGELWQNARGGTHAGGWWNTLLDLSLSADLSRLGGPPASSLIAQLHWVENRSASRCFADATGAFNPVSGLMAADHLRVFNLHYRQSWRDDAVALKFGQLAVDDDFMLSDYAALFANAAFGALPASVATSLASCCAYSSAFPVYGVAAPGLWVRAQLPHSLAWQSGLYHGGPGHDERGNRGFSWHRSAHTGVSVFTELAHTGTFAGRAATWRFGATFHTGHFENFSPASPTASAHGLHSFYAIHDVVLAADAAGAPKLAAFARLGVSPQQDRCVVATSADAGLNWFGPLAARPADTAGVAVTHTTFGRDFRRTAGRATAETTVELTYRAQVTPRFSLQPDLQFLFASRQPAAFILGTRATATF